MIFSLKTKMDTEAAEQAVQAQFREIEALCERNTKRVMEAFYEHRVSRELLSGSTGYGHDDKARDTLDAMWAEVYGAEDAMVRHTFSSGTQTLATMLFAILRPGDTMLSVTGNPYDTILPTIGLSGQRGDGSLMDFGVRYEKIDLNKDNTVNLEELDRYLNKHSVKMVYLQRSRGYTTRNALTINQIEEVVKTVRHRAIVAVDNCYGEFTEEREPGHVGVDIFAGSLIKNPGGGIAMTGGYIAGRKDLVQLAAYRHTAMGLGKDCTPSLDQIRPMTQGFFYAPHSVGQALKCAVLASKLLENAGFKTFPKFNEKRSDIVQTIIFDNPELLVKFCAGIQKGSPIDAFVEPIPYQEDGYEDEIVMASGSFTSGSSIEISADGPIRPPYVGYLQGGLTYESGKYAIMTAYEEITK